MAAEPARGGERTGISAMDHRALRLAGCAAFAVLVAWMAAAAILDELRSPVADRLRYWGHIPLWFAMALAAVYYGRAVMRGLRPSLASRAIAVALIVLPTGASWFTSGWEASVTVALALAAWIAFAATWAIPVAASLGVRGRTAKADICLLCALVPAAWAVLPAAVGILGHTTPARSDAPWRTGAITAVSAAALIIGAAALVTFRARRSARRAASPAGPAAPSPPTFPSP